MVRKRMTNPGRRERVARRRHCRTTVYICGSNPTTRKLGRKHLGRKLRSILSVADSRKTSKSKRCD